MPSTGKSTKSERIVATQTVTRQFDVVEVPGAQFRGRRVFVEGSDPKDAAAFGWWWALMVEGDQ